jgi:hypothetical protein
MSAFSPVYRGDTAGWKDIEDAYNIIAALEDGCTTSDIHSLMCDQRSDEEISLARVSAAVSKLIYADSAPVSSHRDSATGRHTNLRAIRPLPDVLTFEGHTPTRKHRSVEEAAQQNLERMSRTELLKLKIKINELLSRVR